MKFLPSFDDTLIVPKFSFVKSRKDVITNNSIGRYTQFKIPVISANMDTVTDSKMAAAMTEYGGVACLHRFISIEDNVAMFKSSPPSTWCSIGISENELNRAIALAQAGCKTLLIDVAHGASLDTVNQFNKLCSNSLFENIDIIVGNFATAEEITMFLSLAIDIPTAFKVGIGGGSACTTRKKTGCGLPTLASVIDCATTGQVIIADGGIRGPDDVAKCLAAGATAVMVGKLLAGTDESPGEVMFKGYNNELLPFKQYSDLTFIGKYPSKLKIYRGSASKESYDVQNKESSWRTPEGEAFTVSYKGSVKNVLQDIEGGLRSAYSYVNAHYPNEFRKNATLIQVSNFGANESNAHGKGDL